MNAALLDAAMLFRLARFLQFLGLLIVPLAIAGNLAEIAGVEHRLELKQSLVLSGVGIALFYAGWWLQERVKK